ncbi:MAG TPA: alpha/beta fold hydrolase [Steroidobacteraceae bacterium]|nr:alpha/beta fold hydrolase [Steroidobacteraceae bacterium]
MSAPRAERVTIAGPAGAIEALVEIPAGDDGDAAVPTRFGVVCHPHPLYGGTLDNKVVYIVARAFNELGVPTIRFNFRGVGGSSGEHADGYGETADAMAVIAYGRERWPGAALWLGGFSFGGAVAVRAAMRAGAERLVTVAPGITRVAMEGIGSVGCPWLIVQGDADDVIEPAAVLAWARQQAPPRPAVRLLHGAGHFFHGRLNELRTVIVDFLSSQK